MDKINHQSLESQLCYAKNIFQKRRVLCQNTLLKYPPQERSLAVQLTEKGISRAQVAKELDISISAINVWVVKGKKGLLLPPVPRCLTVIPEVAKEEPFKMPISESNYSCEIFIGHGVTIKIAISAVNSIFLKEIKKAVE